MYGKDSCPEDTIRKIKRILKRSGLTVEEVSWKHPVPHVWSVCVREKNCHILSVNGKGTTKALALASALGEFMERVVTGYSFADFALIGLKQQEKFLFSPDEKWFIPRGKGFPAGLLSGELFELYDPDGTLKFTDIVDRMSGGCGRDAVCSIPFTRERDKENVYFPINILDNLYASNGMAAGNTEKEARVQAFSEILERYVKNNIIIKGIALPDIPADRYSSCYHIVKAIEALERSGFSLMVKDASMGGRYPVVNITMVDKKSKKCFLAFGSHPSFEIALTRTLTELLQGQKVSAFRGLKSPAKNRKEVTSRVNLVSHFIDSSGIVSEGFFKKKPAYSFKGFDVSGTREDEERFLLSIFSRAKKDVYVNTVSIDGFYVCRVVVPGWSEVYDSEDLVYANNNRARYLVKYIVTLPLCTRTELKKLLFLFDSGTVGDHEIVPDILGIALDEGSPWERLCFGELKLLVLLALGKKKEAREQLVWCFDVGCLRKKMEDKYECLLFLLEEECPVGFNKNVREKARDLFHGKNIFIDLFTRANRMRGIRTHKKILDGFSRSRTMPFAVKG